MTTNKPKFQPGLGLIEVVITIVLSSIVVLATGVVLVDNQHGWNQMYNRANSDIVTDSYVARKAFDAVIRKASGEKFLLDEAGSWIEVYYYQDEDSDAVDRYTRPSRR